MEETSLCCPPFDPALQYAIGFPGASNKLDLDSSRQNLSESNAAAVIATHPHLVHTEYKIPALSDLDSNNITLSIFESKDSTSRNRVALYYVHGGGQITGNRFFGLDDPIKYFGDIDAVFVSVEYRLAPEHQAPAGAYDSYAGLVYIADHSADLGIDPSKILLYGFSGGAAPALGSAILSRNRKHPPIHAQILSAPMLDDCVDTVSAKQFAVGSMWSAEHNCMAWDMVLGPDRGMPGVDELRAPSRASDLSGLPPTFIDVGECEVFRDEAVAFASKIWKSGGTAELHVWPGLYHGAFLCEPDVPVSKAAADAQKTYIKRVFAPLS